MSNNHLKLMDTIEDRLYRYRARRLKFLINGDKFFTGINYALNTEKIRSYDALLNDLTRSLMDNIKLCKGVRYIFNHEGLLITSLKDFEHGGVYICSSTDNFISTDYRTTSTTINRLVRNSACISGNIRSKRSQVNSNDSNNVGSNSKFLLTPTTKTTSHNNNSSSNSSYNNNANSHSTTTNRSNMNISQQNNQHHQNQLQSPIKSNNNSPNPVARRTPREVFDTNLSHDQKRNTPQSKPTLPANNSVSNKRMVGSQSPQANFGHGKLTAQNRNLFGLDVTEKYDIGRPIGDGHFSVVYFCMNKKTQEFCALKLIDKLKCRETKDDMIYNEVKILKRLNHPNIVKLIEEFDHPEQLYLILELVQDGDLFDAISAVTKFSEYQVATMIHNLSSALTYLHKLGIAHRDIKPENLLISVQDDGSKSLKLADFGLAMEVGDVPLDRVCGTAFYVSPEMLNETGYDCKVDVWSTGVICFILLCGYPPFTSENESDQDELFDAILAGDFQFAPPYWSKISQHAKNLIRSMLTVDPDKRYTAEQVFTHPWTMGTSSNFEGINPMNMSRKIALQSQ